jgi:hypothetical protein
MTLFFIDISGKKIKNHVCQICLCKVQKDSKYLKILSCIENAKNGEKNMKLKLFNFVRYWLFLKVLGIVYFQPSLVLGVPK